MGTLRADGVAGFVLGVQSVPDGLATGLLAGVNPLAGLPRARNLAAAMVVAFSLGGDVVVLTLVAAIVMKIVLILLAGELGRRTTEPAAA
jgi:MFS superfamily sulfate permease-like transporter